LRARVRVVLKYGDLLSNALEFRNYKKFMLLIPSLTDELDEVLRTVGSSYDCIVQVPPTFNMIEFSDSVESQEVLKKLYEHRENIKGIVLTSTNPVAETSTGEASDALDGFIKTYLTDFLRGGMHISLQNTSGLVGTLRYMNEFTVIGFVRTISSAYFRMTWSPGNTLIRSNGNPEAVVKLLPLLPNVVRHIRVPLKMSDLLPYTGGECSIKGIASFLLKSEILVPAANIDAFEKEVLL